jgi:hypothetical protein
MGTTYGSRLTAQQKQKVLEIALAVCPDGFTISCNEDFALLGYMSKDRARDRVRELGQVGVDYIIVPNPGMVPFEDYLLTRQFVEEVLARSRSEMGKQILKFYRGVRDSYFRDTVNGRIQQDRVKAAHAETEV